jgi:hypothetical protein
VSEAELRKRIDDLERDLGELAVQCRALQELCLRKKTFTREELKALVHEIDMSDGAMDSKVKKLPKAPKE